MITVLTATYNRAHTLERVFDSLERQTERGLEWLVVDDGSTDGTAELMRALAERASFPVRYMVQPNAGRHAALNRGFQEARGELLVVMDSDDWFEDGALERFLREWNGIPAEEREGYAAVAGLCAFPGGDLIGTRYPADPTDSDFVQIRARHRVAGDKKEMFRTDLLRRHPFPVFEGERRVAFSLLLTRLSREHRVRFFNEVVCRKEYLADGVSARVDRVRMESARGARLRYQEMARFPVPLPLRYRARNLANYVRYSLHGGVGLVRQLREGGAPLLWLATLPLGWYLYRRDRRRGGAGDHRPTARG